MNSKSLKIVILTGSNPFNNAGIFACDMLKSLKNEGHDVILLTRNYDKRLVGDMKYVYGKRESYLRDFIYKVKFRLLEKRKTDPMYCMHSLNEISNYISTRKILNLIPFKPDLIIYLFSHRFLNARNLYELSKTTNSPIGVMPVDMALFTGGCHYANECEGYKKQCGSCPGIHSKNEKDITYKNLIFQRKYIAKTNLFTITNTWLSGYAKQSSIFSGKHDCRMNLVIDETMYCPGNKTDAKSLFGIPENKNIIFFGAASVHEKRKGFSYLVEAIKLLYNELNEKEHCKIGIAVAGVINSEIKDLFPFEVFFLGHLTHDQLIHAYRMADVFVSPSIQDAGPMMVAQSMMCGTPVVAFEMGNAVDYIQNGKTGYSVSLGDSKKLEEGIRKVLLKTTDEKELMARQCRELALSKSSYKAFEKDLVNNYYNFINRKQKNND